MITAGGYLTAYPKTPWNTQQLPATAIGAAANMNDGALGSVPAASVTTYNANGTLAAPDGMEDFGAIGYWRSGQANEKYDLVGSGKKGNASICVFHLKNY
ncbi:hypothetical protein D3C86_1774430 [compost metagenome]